MTSRLSFAALLLILSCVLASIGVASAAEIDTGAQFTPQVGIPGSEFVAGESSEVSGTTIGEWVSAVYVFLAGVMGVIAAMMVLWGGIKWTTASGNTSKVQDAKDTIYSALIALLLTFGSYVLLNTINPELVKIRDITDLLPPIEGIEQITELPRRISGAILGNAGLTSEKNSFNAQACPTIEEMRNGVEVFLTGYYRPAWPQTQEEIWKPSGGYPSFPCNVGMQCSCPRDKTKICQAGGLTWNPCDITKMDPQNYCHKTASGGRPVEFFGGEPPYTAAASGCFGFGTTFTLTRAGGTSKAFTSAWAVGDRGGDIQGRHLDLFMGTGDQALSEAVNITGRAVMKVSRYCSKPGDCQDLTEN